VPQGQARARITCTYCNAVIDCLLRRSAPAKENVQLPRGDRGHVVMNKLMLPMLPREAEKLLDQEAKERERREQLAMEDAAAAAKSKEELIKEEVVDLTEEEEKEKRVEKENGSEVRTEGVEGKDVEMQAVKKEVQGEGKDKIKGEAKQEVKQEAKQGAKGEAKQEAKEEAKMEQQAEKSDGAATVKEEDAPEHRILRIGDFSVPRNDLLTEEMVGEVLTCWTLLRRAARLLQLPNMSLQRFLQALGAQGPESEGSLLMADIHISILTAVCAEVQKPEQNVRPVSVCNVFTWMEVLRLYLLYMSRNMHYCTIGCQK
jgi:hypothetical protein